MRLFLTTFFIIQLFGVFAQNPSSCAQNFDLRNWNQEGHVDQSWTFNASGSSGRQLNNGYPSFLVNNANLINVRLQGKIEVSTNHDNDYIGFVFGYQYPDQSVNQDTNRYYMVDWSMGANPSHNFDGFSLVKVDTVLEPGFEDESDFRSMFWERNSYPGFNILQEGNPTRWSRYTEYEFTLEYTTTRILVIINGGVFNNDTVIDYEGCFEPGRFGFYNYSQANAVYSDFQYEHIADFSVSNNTLCIGDSLNFSASGCSANNYYNSGAFDLKWKLDNDSILNNVSDFNFNYEEAGQHEIKLLISDENQCIDSITKLIEVKPLPEIQLTKGNLMMCEDGVTNVLDSVGQDDRILTWSPNPTGTNFNANTLFGLPVGDNKIKLTVEENGCLNYDSTIVTVVPPIQIILNNSDTICQGDTLNISANTSGGIGNLSANWNDGTNGFSNNLYNEGLHIITVTDSLNCSAKDSLSLEITELPEIKLTKGNLMMCEDGVTNVLDSVGQDDRILTWSPNPTGTNFNANTLFGLPVGDNKIKLTVEENGCLNYDSTIVTVVPPIQIILNNSDTICKGDTLNISANTSGGIGNLSANWNDGTNGFSNNLYNEGLHIVTVTDSLNCSAKDSLSLEITELPEIKLTKGNLMMCEDGVTNVLDSVGQDDRILTWSPNPTGTNFNANTLFDLPVGDNKIKLTVEENGCLNYDSTIVTVVPPIQIILNNSDTICKGDTLNISATAAGGIGNLTAFWNDDVSGLSRNLFENGKYWLTVVDSIGCNTKDSIELKVNNKPIINLEDSIFLCSNADTLIQMPTDLTYVWEDGSTENTFLLNSSYQSLSVEATNRFNCKIEDSVIVTTPPNPIIELGADTVLCLNNEDFSLSPRYTNSNNLIWSNNEKSDYITINQSGEYWVKAISDKNCIAYDTILVQIETIPDININLLTDESLPCFEEYPNGVILSSNPILRYPYQYYWSTGDTTPTTNINEPREYQLEVSYLNCSKTLTYSVEELCELEFYIPNAFSPNNDLLNDVFKPEGANLSDYEIIIFDRWGGIVYQSTDYNEGWNGRYNNHGKQLPTGVYVYKIFYQGKQNLSAEIKKQKFGSITLIR